MNHEDKLLLSAFFDGERMDRRRLVEALDDPTAIDVLREFARLAAELETPATAPHPSWVAVTRTKLGRLDAGPWWRRWVPVPAPALAAAVLVLAVAGGWGWYALRSAPSPESGHPPAADRTIAFEAGKDWHRIDSN
jgi:hypothetical protein